MSLSRLKFKEMSSEDILDTLMEEAYSWGFHDSYHDFLLLKVSSESKELLNRLLDKDIEILRLRREADKVQGLRMGEIR